MRKEIRNDVFKSGEIGSSRPPEKKRMTKEEVAKHVARMRERDSELVTGVFKILEEGCRGGSTSFNFKAYPGDDFKTYWLVDGERYRLPRGVAKHLNNRCYYREYRHLKGEKEDNLGIRAGYNDGTLKAENMQMSRKVFRYAFHSLEFMDEELDMKPGVSIIEVTTSP